MVAWSISWTDLFTIPVKIRDFFTILAKLTWQLNDRLSVSEESDIIVSPR